MDARLQKLYREVLLDPSKQLSLYWELMRAGELPAYALPPNIPTINQYHVEALIEHLTAFTNFDVLDLFLIEMLGFPAEVWTQDNEMMFEAPQLQIVGPLGLFLTLSTSAKIQGGQFIPIYVADVWAAKRSPWDVDDCIENFTYSSWPEAMQGILAWVIERNAIWEIWANRFGDDDG